MALTKISNNSLSAISSLPASIPTGALTLLSTQTASASASIEFTSGIDSTYSSYIFKMIDIHAGTDNVNFTFQGSTNGGSSYGVTITSTYFNAYHNESDSQTSLNYDGTNDLAQSTSFQMFTNSFGADNDQQGSGTLQIFNPSSSVFVKHFIARLNNYHASDYSVDAYVAGYFNDGANAINAIKFQMSSGNFDGIIKMYGVS
jgi:hypothetical protein